MKKGLIIRNGGIFLISMIAIIFSVGFLGRQNLMVGANAVFLLVGILNKNFTNTPVKSLFKITTLTIFIGVLPYLVNYNIYSGIVINFVGIFILLYAIVYNLNKSIYYPFLFGYTLLLSSNVVGRELLFRVIGLAIVGIAAVLFQIFYMKICEEKPMQSLKRSLDSLIKYIDLGKEEDLDEFMETNAKWSREILEYKGRSFYLNYKEDIELNLVAILDKIENINSEIIKGDKKYHFKEVEKLRKDACKIIKHIRDFTYKNLKEEELQNYINIFKSKYLKEENILVYEIVEEIEVLKILVVNLSKIEWKQLKVRKRIKKRDLKESVKILKADFDVNSIRFIFAFRTAILISICYFIVEYYHIEYGKWIIFTIASVSQPYNETIKNRAKERIIGTLIGAGIYYSFSLIFTRQDEKIFIIFLAIYFYIHFKKYVENVAMITIMFLGLATLNMANTAYATEQRIFFILIGSLVVVIGNKIIFPYDFKKETKFLLKRYLSSCNEAYDSIINIYKDTNGIFKIKNLILHIRGLENKILLNNIVVHNEETMNLIREWRIVINCIQNSFNRIEYFDITLKLNGNDRIENLKVMEKQILKSEDIDCRCILDKYMNETIHKSEKLIYKDMYEMILSKKAILKILKDIDKR